MPFQFMCGPLDQTVWALGSVLALATRSATPLSSFSCQPLASGCASYMPRGPQASARVPPIEVWMMPTGCLISARSAWAKK